MASPKLAWLLLLCVCSYTVHSVAAVERILIQQAGQQAAAVDGQLQGGEPTLKFISSAAAQPLALPKTTAALTDPVAFCNSTQCAHGTTAGLAVKKAPTFTTKCPDGWKPVLDMHNLYRAKHGAPALTYSQSLADAAQKYLDYMGPTGGCTGSLRHDPNRGFAGENLFAAWSSNGAGPTCLDALVHPQAGWYTSEVGNYRFTKTTPYIDNQANFMRTGHFTQAVWVGTSQIGCAIHKCKTSPWQIVGCRYSGPGNYIGNTPYMANVKSCKCGKYAADMKLTATGLAQCTAKKAC